MPGGSSLPSNLPKMRPKLVTSVAPPPPPPATSGGRTSSEAAPISKAASNSKVAPAGAVSKHDSDLMPPPPPPPKLPPIDETLYPPELKQASSVSDVVGNRLKAIRKLQSNPNDEEAKRLLHEADQQVKIINEKNLETGNGDGGNGWVLERGWA